MKPKEKIEVKNRFKELEEMFSEGVEEKPQQVEENNSKRAVTRNQKKIRLRIKEGKGKQ